MSNYDQTRVGAKTDQGPVRPVNEDHYWVTSSEQPNQLGALYIVADGVGGQEHGSAASRIATDIISRAYYEARGNGGSIVNSLADAILAANDAIFAESQNRGGGKMGSTLVTAVQYNGELTIAHIGDARAYLVTGNRLRRLTKDDTWVQKQVDAGIITKEDAAKHELRNVVTQVLGNKPELDVHISPPIDLSDGDIFMLCSDGVYDVIEKEQLYRTLKELNPQQAAESLLQQAIANGTTDNVTAIVVNAGKISVQTNKTMRESALPLPPEAAAAPPDAENHYEEPAKTEPLTVPAMLRNADAPTQKDRFPRWGIFVIVGIVLLVLLVVLGVLLLRNDNIGITFSSSDPGQSGETDPDEEAEEEAETAVEEEEADAADSTEAPVTEIIITPTPIPPTATVESTTPPADNDAGQDENVGEDEPSASPPVEPTPQIHACTVGQIFVWTDQQVNSGECGLRTEITLAADSEVILLSALPRAVRGPDAVCNENNPMSRIQDLADPTIIGWVLDYQLEPTVPNSGCPPQE